MSYNVTKIHIYQISGCGCKTFICFMLSIDIATRTKSDVPVQEEIDAFRSISPLSIASITVLKDDSSEAKAYGENVSVIKIETNKEENGLLESLKNLPGVKVEADGSITVNGQPVKKITINGRSYSVSAE